MPPSAVASPLLRPDVIRREITAIAERPL